MDSFGFMTCTLKLDTNCPKWHVTLLKVLRNIPGNIDPDEILRLFERAGECVQLLKLQSGSSSTGTPINMPTNYYDYGGYNYHGYGGYIGGYGSTIDPRYNWHSHHHQPYYYKHDDHYPTSYYHYPGHEPLPRNLNPYYAEKACTIM
ncbi:hypothetical protein ACFE04_018823 [Oxalis oulophora]